MEKNAGDENIPLKDEEVFRHILSLLRIRKGTDFTYYKQTTIRRRILRRMAFNRNEAPADYLIFLRAHKQEQDILYQDLLIPVTNFFRDPKSFENLHYSVFTRIIKNKTNGDPVRVWVAGCSTGEEAYSIAICLREYLDGKAEKVQIFATDISEPAIAKARLGIYSKQQLEGISPGRLQEFFIKKDGSYQVEKNIREMCVFAVHNFLKDPPFGRLDFISCRNVLIYMEPYLQKKALITFHYALNPEGFLLLGKSETISNVPDLYAPVVKNDKLFSRKDVPGKFMVMASQKSEQNFRDSDTNPPKENVRTDFQKTADDIMFSRFSPAGVVVNEAMDIVHFRGNTSNYLEQASGKPTHNLLKMAKQGLPFELRNILHKAKKEKASSVKENIPVQINGKQHHVTLEAILLPDTIEPHYLILFHETPGATLQVADVKTSSKLKKDEKDKRIEQLEKELAQTRDDMRSITEDQEASNEELQSANEELLSGSEELQSLNEELETGKEELQSTNEELTVVNQEMVGLMEQIKQEKDYAQSIIETIRDPLLVLNKNLRVVSANTSFYRTFRVNEAETEGKLIYELSNGQWNIPELKTLLEKIVPEKSKFNDFEIKQTFSQIGERIMLLNARELKESGAEKLILLAIEDITDQKRVAEERLAKKRFQFIADAMPQKVWTADEEGNVNYFNKTWLKYTGLSFDELKDWGWKKIIHPDDWEENKKEWQHCIDTGSDFEIEHRFLDKEGKYKWHLSRGLAIKEDDGKIKMWIGTNTEIHEQKKQKEELEKAVLNRTYELQQANAELSYINRTYEHAEQIGLFGSYRYNFNTKELSYSDNLYRLLGCEPNEFRAAPENFMKFTHPDDRQYVSDATAEAFINKHTSKWEYRMIRKDGKQINVRGTGKLITDSENVQWMIGTLQDISDEKNREKILLENEEKFNSLFQFSPFSITLAESASGRMMDVNENYVKTFGYSREELIGKTSLELNLIDEKVREKILQSLVKHGAVKNVEVEIRKKSGEKIPVLVSIETITINEKKYFLNAINDIIDRKKAEEKIAEKNKELENLNKELQSFAYVASHDLQEPLRKIQTFSTRLMEKEALNLTETGTEYFHRMQKAAKRMQTLIEDLLSFSRAGTAERKFEFTDINKIIDEIKNDFKEDIEEKHAIIETNEMCEANLIRFQFRQLMQNLIGNALKFSIPGKPPHIHITSHIIKGNKLNIKNLSPGKEYCHITVRDNGIGFEPHFNEKIFEVFQRLHGKSEYAGTGIGLAIVKKIVENHHGIITATSQLGKGAQFDIYIPAF